MNLRDPNESFPEALSNYLSNDPMIQMVQKRYLQTPERQSLVFILLEDLIATAGRTCNDRPDQFHAYLRPPTGPTSDAQDDLVEEISSDMELSADSFSEEDLEDEADLACSLDHEGTEGASGTEGRLDELTLAPEAPSVSSDLSVFLEDSPSEESSEDELVTVSSELTPPDSPRRLVNVRADSEEDYAPSKKSKLIKPVHVPTEPICVLPENSLIELLYRYGNGACWTGLLREMARCGHVNHLRYWLEGRWISRQIAKNIFAVLRVEHPRALDQFWGIAPKYDYAILSTIFDARDRKMFEHVFQRLGPKQLKTRRIANFAATLECTTYWFALNQEVVSRPVHPNLITECYRHELLSMEDICDRMASKPAMAKKLLDRLALPEMDADQLVYHLLRADRSECAVLVDNYYQVDPDTRLARAIWDTERTTKHIVAIIEHLEPDLLANDGYFYRMMFKRGIIEDHLIRAVKKYTSQTSCRFYHSAKSKIDAILLASNYSVIIPGFFHWQMEGVYFCSPSYEIAGDAFVANVPKGRRAIPSSLTSPIKQSIEYGINYCKQSVCSIPTFVQAVINDLQASGGFTRAKSARSVAQ